jgi:ABC-2 type transport system permease protein
MVISGTFSGIANSIVVALIAWLVLGLVPVNFLTLVLVVAAGSLLFSLFTLTVLLLPVRPDKGQEVFSFLMMPMTFFGCTFYSLDMLEPQFRYFALLFPTTYISEGLRAAYAPAAPHLDLPMVLTGFAVATMLLLPLADFAFRRRLGHFTW